MQNTSVFDEQGERVMPLSKARRKEKKSFCLYMRDGEIQARQDEMRGKQ
jgi:hypothetical protein